MSSVEHNEQLKRDEFRAAQSLTLIAVLSFAGGLALSHAWQDPAFGLRGTFTFFAVLAVHILFPKLSLLLGSRDAYLSFQKLPQHAQSQLQRKLAPFPAPPLIEGILRKLFSRCYEICGSLYEPPRFTSTKRYVCSLEHCFKQLIDVFSAQVLRRPPPRRQA